MTATVLAENVSVQKRASTTITASKNATTAPDTRTRVCVRSTSTLAEWLVGLVDFNVFASVLSLHRSTGGNLPIILDRLAAATRDRNQFEGQYRAATVLGRYSAAFIIFMVLVILVFLSFFQRDWFLRFFDVSLGYTGLMLFLSAITLEVLGGLLLYWFMKRDY